MSISGISSFATSYSQPTNNQESSQQSFGQLVSALNSGNLQDAQQAYATLSQQQGSNQGSSANSNNPFSQALSQIGQALQSGDLAGAQ